jgi:hypothetical protein
MDRVNVELRNESGRYTAWVKASEPNWISCSSSAEANGGRLKSNAAFHLRHQKAFTSRRRIFRRRNASLFIRESNPIPSGTTPGPFPCSISNDSFAPDIPVRDLCVDDNTELLRYTATRTTEREAGMIVVVASKQKTQKRETVYLEFKDGVLERYWKAEE